VTSIFAIFDQLLLMIDVLNIGILRKIISARIFIVKSGPQNLVPTK